MERAMEYLTEAHSPWNRFAIQLLIAFSEVVSDKNYLLARQRIAECYLSLLPGHGLDPMLGEYKEALKHVVDSLWLWTETNRFEDQHFAGGSDEKETLLAFLRTIKPFDTMDRKQKSAVLAIRGKLRDQYGGDSCVHIQKALKFYSKEGQWHCELGIHFQTERRLRTGKFVRSAPSVEEMSALRKAVARRRTAESCASLVISLFDTATREGITEGMLLMKAALQEFPDNKSIQDLASYVHGIMDTCIERGQLKELYFLQKEDDPLVELPLDIFETLSMVAARANISKKGKKQKPSK